MKFADDTFPLQFAHGVEGHQAIRILPNELRVIATVGDFVIFGS